MAVAGLAREFDASRGGFGGAPKFPPSMVLEFLLRHAERAPGDSGPQALAMAQATAEAMARGGMYDQLAGGFARYSVDADWVIPHFEKMLYDNALLARVYAHLWRRTGSPLARRVAAETCDWLITELRTAQGGFASALDADSDGAEGAFYVWTPGQLAAALGEADGATAARIFGVTAAGTFEQGASVLQLREDPPAAAEFARLRAALLAARAGGRGRVATTKWSPPGTGWPSPRWPRLACFLIARTSSLPPSGCRLAGQGAHRRWPAGPHLQGRPGIRHGWRPRRLRLRRGRLHRTGRRRHG